jgi:hypothetical protein
MAVIKIIADKTRIGTVYSTHLWYLICSKKCIRLFWLDSFFDEMN